MRVPSFWFVAYAGLGASTACLPDAPPRPGFTDSTGADDSTVDSDSDDSDSGDSGTLDPTSREIHLYEPCEDLSPGMDAGCTPGGPAYTDLGSTWRRTDEPTEIVLVVEGVSEWNTPGAQPDFDDVRVVVNGTDAAHEIVGARLHSDTPCSMASDDGTWAHRDDLCGVEAWWPLQGDGVEVISVTGAGLGDGLSPGAGLYGQEAGSMTFAGGSSHLRLEDSAAIQLPQAGTWELWFRRPAGCPDGQEFLIAKNHSGDHVDGLIWLESSCEVRFFRDSGIDFTSSPLDVTAWHHLAITWDSDTFWVYIDGLPVLEAGQGGGIVSSGNPLFVGATGENDGVTATYGFAGLIADVLVHSVTKSADYIYRRARPRFPVVRFLADTEETANAEGHFPFQATTLDWGDESATYPAPLVDDPESGATCYGLLSPCNGYVGWWRFEEGGGSVACDDSTMRGHATVPSPAVWETAPGDGALTSAGSWLTIPNDPVYDLEAFSIESLLWLDSAEQAAYALKKSGSYDLLVKHDDFPGIRFGYAPADGSQEFLSALGASPTPIGAWFAAGGRTDGQTIEVLLNYRVDGTAIATSLPINSSYGLAIAQNSIGAGSFVDGFVADVRVMNRAVSDDAQLHHPLSQYELGPVGSTP